ncbi:PQQ-binding-like beta-propeller repeat protein [Paeniglutamicibacter antarcticus]|uniref:PQQ-binding-like beta-propeller repeat protein n=1 Tax=Arthrobacter terrae TaxID=2935737 RepID=A0A931CSJ0_9MICC|nr:PQQ-binding-like beta-propeller repeat protein [Arthrobacter terrae]MBG0738953.1 PQQ-binding-like beta-propeller repeat protein [Arthrobacter terrae]
METRLLPSRRAVLSWAVVAGVTAALAPAAPAMADITPGTTTPTTLRTIAGGAGIKRTYDDVFLTVAFLDMRIVNDLKGAPKLVTTTSGVTNQFQIIDLATGNLEYVDTVPIKISSKIGWNPSTHTVYFGRGDGHLMSWSFTDRKLKDYGKVHADATGIYGMEVSDDGRVWGGFYPNGIIWSFDPRTNAFTTQPRIDEGTDYVYGVAITGGTVYAGTGSRDAKIVSFPISNPAARTIIRLPESAPTGQVPQLFARGDRMFVFAEDAANLMRCFIYNLPTKRWEPRFGASPIRSFTGTATSSSTWTVAGGSVVNINTTTMAMTTLVTAGMDSPRSVYQDGDRLYVAGSDAGEPMIAEFSIARKTLTRKYAAKCKPGALSVQSLIASATGVLYAGGYQGNGIASIHPDTNARWQSVPTSGVGQIEHMMELDRDSIFIGSYGSGQLFRYTRSKQSTGAGAFKLIVKLRTDYMQSRPFGWATAGGKVLVGTVPEYGLRGGALGFIDPKTDAITVKNKFIPEQSIVGLGGDGNTVYGTTSGRPGYGAPDYTGAAAVFAYDVAKDRVIWTVYLDGQNELYSPLLIDGELVVSTINGLIILDPGTGKVLRTHMLRNRSARPGYLSVRTLQLPGTSKVVHNAGGILTLIDLRAGTRSELASGAYGTQMAIRADGRLFASKDHTHVVELHTDAAPAISSKADLVTITHEGHLLSEASSGHGVFGNPVDHGAGWDRAGTLSFHVVDWDANGIPDILIQCTNGSLQLRRGVAGGGFQPPVTVGNSGWTAMQITVGNWNNTTPYPAVLAVDPAGNLLSYQVSSTGGLMAPVQLGTGWKGRQPVMMDMTGAGKQGIVARDGAKLVFQDSNGNGRFTGAEKVVAQAGWSDTVALAAVDGHYGDRTGLVSLNRSGGLRYISSTGTGFGGIINYPGARTGALLAGSSRF